MSVLICQVDFLLKDIDMKMQMVPAISLLVGEKIWSEGLRIVGIEYFPQGIPVEQPKYMIIKYIGKDNYIHAALVMPTDEVGKEII